MKRSFTTNEFYHLFNRGVDKRKIFLNKNDYIRFIHDLYEFNDIKPAFQFSRSNRHYVGRRTSNTSNIEDRNRRDRDCLVNIHVFTLMPNHHHGLIEQLTEGGISLFMKKLHGGYARAFNEKYKRSGYLFQGRFKEVYTKSDTQLAFLICYIHSNPLNIWKPNWKEKKLTDSEIKEALRFLENYRWSSHLDYMGIRNFPSVIHAEFLLKFFGGTKDYKIFFIDWLRQYKKNVEDVQGLTLE